MTVNNLFVAVHRWSEGALTIVVFIASLTLFLCGCVLFVEDTWTSYMGIQAYEGHFGLTMARWNMTYLAQSIIPQVGQIILFYIFFSNMKKNWWAPVVAIAFLLIDFYADLYYRTQSTLNIATLFEDRTIAGAIVTLFFFTIGAEFFISLGWGVAMTTFAPAIRITKRMVSDQAFALGITIPSRSRGNSNPMMLDNS